MKDEPALSLRIEKLLEAMAPVRAQIPKVRFNNDDWTVAFELNGSEMRAIVKAMDDAKAAQTVRTPRNS